MTATVDSLPSSLADRIKFQPCPVPDLDGDCWIWSGTLNHKGYGHVYVDGRTQRVHRYTYEHLVAPIPEALQLDHLCRVAVCCNPSHLEPVTNAVNSARTERATKTHCIRNHPLSGPNLIVKSESSKGRRQCRECKRLSRLGLLTKDAECITERAS